MAANQLSEQEIQFRKRARRRLVGAVALVLVMVTVLPMLLDDRQANAPQPDIAISIPSQDGNGFTSRIVPVSPTTPATQTVPPATSVQLAPPLEKPETANPSIGKPQVVAPSTPAASSALETAPVPRPAASDEPAKPVAAKPTAAKAAPATKPVPKNGAFSVQIGVFSDGANVKQLEEKLVVKGFHPYKEVMETPKGDKIRLRIGPYPTRPAAEAALEKLKAASMSGMVVTNK